MVPVVIAPGSDGELLPFGALAKALEAAAVPLLGLRLTADVPRGSVLRSSVQAAADRAHLRPEAPSRFRTVGTVASRAAPSRAAAAWAPPPPPWSPSQRCRRHAACVRPSRRDCFAHAAAAYVAPLVARLAAMRADGKHASCKRPPLGPANPALPPCSFEPCLWMRPALHAL